MSDATSPAEIAAAKALLDRLAARPRPAGSDAEGAARAHCAERLRAAGFAVREEPFAYSAFPGRWATPLVGVASLLTMMGAPHFGYHGQPRLALAIWLAGATGIGLFAWWSARHGVLDAPLARARAVNLVATRGEAPRVWLVAHVDSKSQPVPIAARMAGITLSALAWLATAACLALGVAPGTWPWPACAVVGLLAALPVIASTVGARSDGALDNASGVASVVLAAERLPRTVPAAVLVTSAEELGLAGARAWARAHPATGGDRPLAINVDGVDDAGAMTIMTTGARGGAVTEALLASARDEGLAARARRLLPGLLVDAVALAAGGWGAATVSRGTLRTLLPIHTAADRAARLTGAGIAGAARVIARAAERLATTSPDRG